MGEALTGSGSALVRAWMQNRRAVRKVPRTVVGVQFLVDGYVVAHGEVSDISLGGAGFWSAEDFQAGDSLELRLEAEDRLLIAVQTRAEVVWCHRAIGDRRRARFGVRWAFGPGIERNTLEDFIAATCPDH